MTKAIAIFVVAVALVGFSDANPVASERDLNEKGCGLSKVGKNEDPRVVGGTDVVMGQYPWMASLVFDHRAHICGATIIDDYWVLCAAHCYINSENPKFYTVKAGAHNIHTTESQAVSHTVKRIIPHSSYQPAGLKNDVALMEVDTPFNFSSPYINRVCLPPSSKYNVDGKTAVIVGWGDRKNVTQEDMPSIQQHAKTTIQKERICNKYWGWSYSHKNQLCALSDSTAVCSGDSGGPIHVADKDGAYVQVGIASFVGASGCLTKYPNVFTRVSSYLSWIKGILGQ